MPEPCVVTNTFIPIHDKGPAMLEYRLGLSVRYHHNVSGVAQRTSHGHEGLAGEWMTFKMCNLQNVGEWSTPRSHGIW